MTEQVLSMTARWMASTIELPVEIGMIIVAQIEILDRPRSHRVRRLQIQQGLSLGVAVFSGLVPSTKIVLMVEAGRPNAC